MAEKQHMDIVFIGHVDHGKSTLVARLLLETGGIDPHIIEKYRVQAESMGKSSFELAWVLDDLKEERERGVTIRSQIAEFSTTKYDFTISDAPGHKDFIVNMIRGTRQAESAILVVAATEGVMPQTKEHLILAKTFGIGQVIVAVNKMDAIHPPYNAERYYAVKENVEELLKSIGYKENEYNFIPVCAYFGDNVGAPSKNFSWYNGDTLLEALNRLESQKMPIDLPLRWPIREIMKVPGMGYIPVGFIESGTMEVGDVLLFMPANKKGEVRSMERHHKAVRKATAGDPTGVDFRVIGNWDKKRELRGGHVAGHVSNPPTVAKTFTARIIIFNHPGTIQTGYSPMIHCHEARVKCTMTEIEKKIDPRTMEVIEEYPYYLKKGDFAIVKFKPLLPLVIEKGNEIPKLGRFAIRDMGQTIGAGMVMDIEKKEF